VFWAAGSLLLAAESPQTPKPAPATQSTGQAATTDSAKTPTTKSEAQAGAADEKKKDDKDTKDGDKRSISEQAEAALKAANEADGSAAALPKSDAKGAVDETQAPPSASAAKAPSPQRFVPSEQVRADFDVSFPIDI
jgi:hypothetical protein